LLALLICAQLLSLAACREKETNEENFSDNTAGTTEGQTETETEDSDNLPEKNFNGANYTMSIVDTRRTS